MTTPRTFVLYCKELPDREETVRAHMAERGVDARFIRSIHGHTWGLHTSQEYDKGKRIPPGHVGLNVGTWAMWQHALLSSSSPDEKIIFFEDDVELPENYHQQLEDLLADLTVRFPNWDLAYLGLAEREPHVWHKVTERIGGADSHLCRLDSPFGTHAYMVRARALGVLLDAMTGAQRNLDQQLWERVLSRNLLRWCAVLPGFVRQRTFDHDGVGKPSWGPSTLSEKDLPEESEIPKPEWEASATRTSIDAHSSMVDPFPCIYRGEMLADDGRSQTGKMIPVSQCARLSVPCHSRMTLSGVGRVTAHNGMEALWCGGCVLRTRMNEDKARSKLDLPDGHFNPSIHTYEGRVILATRDSWGHSRVALWEMTNTMRDWTGVWRATPISSLGSPHPQAPRLEDPRLFLAPDPESGRVKLHAMFNLPDGYPPKKVRVGYVAFSSDLQKIERTEVYPSPNSCLYEKNWVPFWSERESTLRWVYSTKPHHTVLGQSSYTTPNNLPWAGGFVRGGAAPVLVPATEKTWHKHDVFYHFFHGCLKRLQGSVYTTGCAVFEAQPPFKVLKQTAVPLLWPDLPAVGEDVVKRYVCWPGGVVFGHDAWHLAVGVDDTFCRMVRIPAEEVEAALTDVPEDESTVSLRDTILAGGSKRE